MCVCLCLCECVLVRVCLWVHRVLTGMVANSALSSPSLTVSVRLPTNNVLQGGLSPVGPGGCAHNTKHHTGRVQCHDSQCLRLAVQTKNSKVLSLACVCV